MSDNFDNRRIPGAFRYNETPNNLFVYEKEYALAHCISADFSLGIGIARSFNARYGTRADLKSIYGSNVLRFWQGHGFCLISNDGHVFNLVVKGYENQRATYETVREALVDMREAALKRFSVDNADKLVSEIQVDFTLLGDTEEYKQYRGLEKILMYDTVRVYDPTLDLDEKLRVKAFSWDAVNERYDSVTLSNAAGGPSASVGGYSIVNGSIKLDKLSADAIAKLKS